MNALAIRMCLTDKVKNDTFIAIESLKTDGKAKTFASMRRALPGAGRKTLVIAPEKDEALLRSARNVKSVGVRRAMDVNVIDLLHHTYVIVSKDAVATLEKRLAK